MQQEHHDSVEDADDSSKVIAEAERARRQFIYGAGTVVATLVGLVSLVLFVFYFASGEFKEPDLTDSVMGTYSKWAVVTGVPACKHIARELYSKNGTMADAAVATLLCMGVVHPHASGIGGGFVAMYYHNVSRRARVLIATETAPRAARRDNFTDSKAFQKGWKSVAVPGALYGYYALLSEIGTTFPWEKLFTDAALKASEGVEVDEALADAILHFGEDIKREETLKPIFWNTRTKDLYREGEVMRNSELSHTLKTLAETSFRSFYSDFTTKRSLAATIMDDLEAGDSKATSSGGGADRARTAGSLLTREDLEGYRPVWKDALRTNLSGGLVLFTTPPPTSGAVLAYIMGVMDAKKKLDEQARPNQQYALTLANMHYLAESFKFALSKRSQIGDDDFVDIRKEVQDMVSPVYAGETMQRIRGDRALSPEEYATTLHASSDHGTSNLILYAPTGDVLIVSSTLHSAFGSMRVSRSTGVMMNNALADFSELEAATRVVGGGGAATAAVGAAQANSMAPFKRPLTSLCPTLVLGKGTLLAIGGAGGLRVPTSLAQVVIRALWENGNIKRAIDYPRIHVDVLTGAIQHEPRMPSKMVHKLRQKGHAMEQDPDDPGLTDHYSFVTGLMVRGNIINTNNDKRGKVGGADGD
ncbi:scoloptoxin SSD14-like [Haemaphysalis longicornis]